MQMMMVVIVGWKICDNDVVLVVIHWTLVQIFNLLGRVLFDRSLTFVLRC